MAQRVETILIDDVDGGKADETLEFALDGSTYEIDLSSENARRLRESFDQWASKARRTSKKRVSTSPARSDKNRLKQIRDWARDNGHTVSDRGRVSRDIEQAYDQAHRESA